MFTIVMGALAAFAAMGALAMCRRWVPEWWARRSVKLIGLFFVLVPLLGLGGFVGGLETGSYGVYRISKIAIASAFTLAVPIFCAVVIAVGWLNLGRRRASRKSLDADSRAASRRRFLRAALVAPAASVGLSAAGLVEATLTPQLRDLEVPIEGLDARLDGFRILQVTDAHLGPFVGLDDIERLAETLADSPPDLIVITGDLADFLWMIGPALGILSQLKPRCGLFASMGNHEYHHPPQKLLEAFDKAGVPLLVSDGTTLAFGDAPIYLAAADDPDAAPGADTADFLERSVSAALDNWPSGVTSLLMSHRPPGFESAAKFGVDLTLAGHTHGYQLGVGGRSVGELFGEGHYPRGFYRKGKSQLYTSAGFGHWFPFRLGCAREAPVFTLRRTTSS